MGYDLLNWEARVQVRVSRHNDERDAEDDAAFEKLTAELNAAVDAIVVKPEYARIEPVV